MLGRQLQRFGSRAIDDALMFWMNRHCPRQAANPISIHGKEWPLLGLVAKPIEGVIAGPRTGLDCFGAEARGLIKRGPLAAAEAIGEIGEDWTDRINNLACGGGHSRRGASPGDFADGAQLFFNRAQVIDDGRYARIEFARSGVEHLSFLRARGALFFRGVLVWWDFHAAATRLGLWHRRHNFGLWPLPFVHHGPLHGQREI
jgi:hypothetical protein